MSILTYDDNPFPSALTPSAGLEVRRSTGMNKYVRDNEK
jgi:hypothetical protein